VTLLSDADRLPKLHFWFSVYIDGVDFVDGACITENLPGFPRNFKSDVLTIVLLNFLVSVGRHLPRE